jgi:Protein of unknown function (DUF1579)
MRTVPSLFQVVLLLAAGWGQQASNSPPQMTPCAAPEQKQLDFWIGEWDLTWPGEKQGEVAHGTNSIHRVMDNCVVEENFNGGDSMPLHGMSISLFDVRAGKWKQTWVDNQGSYLDFVGELKDGQMILAREFTRPDGIHIMQRMVFKNISANELDWSWEASKDGGKTWTVNWPIHYKRKN